jgi:hypothetical protein
MFGNILRKALVGVFGTILVKGILLAFNGFATRVEQLIASILGYAVSGITGTAASWIIAGVFGLLVLAAWEVIGFKSLAVAGLRWIGRRIRRSIPLAEATEIAHKKTAGTAYAGIADREAERDKDKTSINRWFAWHIWHYVPSTALGIRAKKLNEFPLNIKTERNS